MNLSRHQLPLLLTLALGAALLLHGPIAQLPDYHDFADRHALFGIPHGRDVLSNAGFALVAWWGWLRLAPQRRHPGLAPAWPGYALFLAGLLLTTFGSVWYHLAPDNERLVWDRLPIALACAGLLAAVWGDVHRRASGALAAGLALFGLAGVAWWYWTERLGAGDLRPYLALQALPMLLIPLWQWIYRRPADERAGFGGALLLYAIAKISELLDHQIAAALGIVSGHTLKHLLATGAAALIVATLVRRVRQANDTAGVARGAARRTGSETGREAAADRSFATAKRGGHGQQGE